MASHKIYVKNFIWIQIKSFLNKFRVLLLLLISCGLAFNIILLHHDLRSKVLRIGFLNRISLLSYRNLCPLYSPHLLGRLNFSFTSPNMQLLEIRFHHLDYGGRYAPSECISRYKVAIISPFRNREKQLPVFLYNIHPILRRQQLDYGIFIIEQSGNGTFNRGKLKNIGFVEALKHRSDYDCFIFYDVDQIPEDDRCLFTCDPDKPSHLASAFKKANYKLGYEEFFGGVVSFTREQFERVNGYPNEFWGWGGEDDDLYNRLIYHGYDGVFRHALKYSRFTMQKHEHDTPSPELDIEMLTGHERYLTDGLNSLKYSRIKFEMKKLYSWVLADVLDDLNHSKSSYQSLLNGI